MVLVRLLYLLIGGVRKATTVLVGGCRWCSFLPLYGRTQNAHQRSAIHACARGEALEALFPSRTLAMTEATYFQNGYVLAFCIRYL